MKRFFLAGAALAALSAGQALAADEVSVEELVITAKTKADVVQVGAFRNAKVIDTPLTVNVITRDVLDAQAAGGLYDALRNTAGVTKSQLNGATYDNIAIRGILVENRGNYRLNGSLPVINLVDQPLENKVRVEVLKGASALYYGFVPPSGVINMTTKRAEVDPTAAITLKGDDNGGRIVAVDVGRQFNDGMFGVRVNLAGGQVASFQDNVKGDRQLAAIALDFNPTDKLSFKFDGEYIAKDVPEPGALALPGLTAGVLVLPSRPDPRLNLASKWQKYDADARNFLVRIDYRLNDIFAVKLEAGRAQTNRNRVFSQFQNYNMVTGAGTLSGSVVEGQKYVNDNMRGELSAKFDTGPLGHDLVIGYTENKRSQNGRQSEAFTSPQNLYNPIAIPYRARTQPLRDLPSTIKDEGVYAFNRVSLGEQFQAILGVRRTNYRSLDTTAGTQNRYAAKKTSPAVSVLYKPATWMSFYGSYLEGFEAAGTAPASAVNNGEVLPPAKTKQKEVGAKAEVRGITASLAYFEIDRPSAYTNAANRFVLDGLVDYKGAEFAAFGSLSEQISITASGLLLDAAQKRAANALVIGKRPENTPKWTASLFAEWKLPMIEGLAINGGVFAMGNRAVNATNQAFIPGYTTADVGVRYTREVAGRTYSGQVNVENVLDKGYWSTAGNNLIGVGAPRTVKLTFSASL